MARASGCLDVGAGNAVEAVYIPEDDRGTLCISSQAGCALDCAFCSTGKQGFNRNLTTAEIVGQLWHANRALLADGGTESPRSELRSPSPEGAGERRAGPSVAMALGRARARADHERRDDGDGRAARQLRRRRPRAVGVHRRQCLRAVAPPRHPVDLRPGPGHRPSRAGVPGRARRLVARARRRAARSARAHQPEISAGRAARRVPPLSRARATRLRDLRVRDARRHQRRARASARSWWIWFATSRASST